MTKHAKNKQLKQVQNQAQTEYMQSNEPQITGREAGKQNRTQIHSQSGRSMIEMLGVLAIIAVLSIGGIVGYRLAMNHYQASQIAHEMNMMRTDAQIKIAQGTEKLMLGEPYDPISESTLGHIQFNDAYPIDFACALADDEAVELSNISCHVANAYYIELQNIPEGVCKPLAELVNGMNNIIAFNVNKNEYPGEGTCEAGNENVLNAVFSAEAVSELKVCTEDTDCESENATYCDPSRHVCVRCYEDSQCARTEYCEDNICKSCDEGLVWNGEECVECTADDDCTDSDMPKCNTETNTCVECIESGDCEEALVCRENECTTCQTEEECQAKGENYHCSNASTCIQCAANQVWDDENRECVECTEDNDCTDTPDTPKCNTTTNQCVECTSNDDCLKKGTDKPICNEENTCVECQQNSFWDGEKCQEGCLQNSDCNKNGNNRSYCHFSASSVCSEQKGYKGTCKSNSPDGTKIINEGEDNEKIFIVKNETMTYWSAQNFCKSHEKDLANISDLDCTNTIPKGTLGYCYQAGGKISSRITELKGEFGGNPYWLFDLYDTSCYAYCIHLDNGHVGYVHRTAGNHYAFCK